MIPFDTHYRKLEAAFGKEKIWEYPKYLTPKLIQLNKHAKKLNLFQYASHDWKMQPVKNRPNEIECQSVPKSLEHDLKRLIPWRKGPYRIGSITIDSEWNSLIKWERILPYLPNIKDKIILDIGSNNGFYSFQLNALAPKICMGLEPHHLYYFQSLVLQECMPDNQCAYLPLTLEEMPMMPGQFDIIFHLGVLYHQKAPLPGLEKCIKLLKAKGIMMIETLTLEDTSLIPSSTYQNMKNIWLLPSLDGMVSWLKRAGFSDVVICESYQTNRNEQRATKWAPYQSLSDGQSTSKKTKEGYPAAQRTLFRCKK